MQGKSDSMQTDNMQSQYVYESIQMTSDADDTGDVGVRVVAFEGEILVLETEQVFYLGIENHTG